MTAAWVDFGTHPFDDVSLWACADLHTRCLIVCYSKTQGIRVGTHPLPFLRPLDGEGVHRLALHQPLRIRDSLDATLAAWRPILHEALHMQVRLPPARYRD